MTVLQDVADERKTEGLDNAVWIAGISCASENRTPLSEKREVSERAFPLLVFLTSNLIWFASFAIRQEMRGTNRGKHLQVENSLWAVLSEEDYRIVISIPAGAIIVLVGGNIDQDPFVKMRHRGRVLLMLAEDLRGSAELLGKSALFAN